MAASVQEEAAAAGVPPSQVAAAREVATAARAATSAIERMHDILDLMAEYYTLKIETLRKEK